MPLISLQDLFPTHNTDTIFDVDAAVIIGDIDFFNHVDDKWVYQFKTAKFFLDTNQQRAADNLKLVLLTTAPSTFRHQTLEGPPGTSPYILTSWDAPPTPVHRGYGTYVKGACKKRKYRIDCLNVAIAMRHEGQDCLYRVKRLYLEGTFQPS